MSNQSAQIVAFPTAARVSDVREAAQTIKCLKATEAEAWWKRRARTMADSLIASGVPEASVAVEIANFQSAVFFELTRLYDTADSPRTSR
jgi:hypothetical protein